ncbi:MAG: hypothetical protein LBL73_09710 [Synergistaceae bacterium]|jgi:hypothetical protein|nr:hypothetical protein [Synergistaceae bacterium]
MGTEITLPSGRKAEITPIDGKTERLLEDKELLRNGTLIDKYLASRIESLDGDSSLTPQQKEKEVLDMRTGDRNFLLYEIRIDSYGPGMTFNYQCPSCKKTSGYQIDLRKLLDDETIKVHPYRDGPLRVELPRSGGYAVIDYMTGREERKGAQLKGNPISGTILIRVKELNGRPPTLKDYDALIGEDLAVIRGGIKEMENGGLFPTLELTCLDCGNEYPADLRSIIDFFAPTKTSTGSAGP